MLIRRIVSGAGGGVLAFALLAAGVAGGAPVLAEPLDPGSPPPPSEVKADPVAEAVDGAAEALMAHEEDPGFGRVRVDYDRAAVFVLWKGEVPPAVRDAIDAASPVVSITVLKAQYSLQDYLDAGAKLVPSPDVAVVMPNADLSGAVVQMVKGSALLATPLAAAQEFEQSIGMPVTIGASVGQPVELTRQNDSTPWWGGGAIANSQGSDYCSIGVPVIRNGNNRLLSARHCFYANGVGSTVRDGVGDSLGTVTNADKDGDTVLITPDSGNTAGYVYGGDWNATSSDPDYFFSITGAANPAENGIAAGSGDRLGHAA